MIRAKPRTCKGHPHSAKAGRHLSLFTNSIPFPQKLGKEKDDRRAKAAWHPQCLESLSAIDSKSLRFVLDIVSKDLISFLTGLPKFT